MSDKSILEIIEEKAAKYITDNDLTGPVDLEIDMTEKEFNAFMLACKKDYLDNGYKEVDTSRKGTLLVKHEPNAVEGELVIRKLNK